MEFDRAWVGVYLVDGPDLVVAATLWPPVPAPSAPT